MRCIPLPAKDRLVAGAARGQLGKEAASLVGQDDVARLTGLGLSDRDRAGIRIEILRLKPRQFALASPRQQRGLH